MDTLLGSHVTCVSQMNDVPVPPVQRRTSLSSADADRLPGGHVPAGGACVHWRQDIASLAASVLRLNQDAHPSSKKQSRGTESKPKGRRVEEEKEKVSQSDGWREGDDEEAILRPQRQLQPRSHGGCLGMQAVQQLLLTTFSRTGESTGFFRSPDHLGVVLRRGSLVANR